MNNNLQLFVKEALENEPFDCGALTKEQWLEKFAELIVRECATISDKWVDDTDNGQNYPSEIIKQHFGIKE